MTLSFGLYNYWFYRGEKERAKAILEDIVSMDCNHEAFVYKQARQELDAH